MLELGDVKNVIYRAIFSLSQVIRNSQSESWQPRFIRSNWMDKVNGQQLGAEKFIVFGDHHRGDHHFLHVFQPTR